MLSYEEIFKRHSRPVTFLNRHLDSPVTRIHSPVVLRSQIAYKERRRPTSIACLSSLYSYRDKETAPRTYDDDYRISPFESNLRSVTERPKLPFKENISTASSDNYYWLTSKNAAAPSISRERLSWKDSSRKTSENYKHPLKENISIISRDNYWHPLNRSSSNENLYSKDIAKTSNNHRHPLKDNTTSRTAKDSHMNLSKYSDDYRHAIPYPDRHFSRRELPLCTPEELLDIIREPVGYYALPTDPWNEVYPDVYLSDAPTALCTAVLKRLGVTHVLNAAQGREKGCGQVNTTPGFYLNSGIRFHGVPAFDNIVFKIYPYFEEAAQFIEDGLKAKGKVLVHCRAGISRSATLVCAFLMIKKGMTAQEAVRTVRKHREIIPNDGFLQQLCDLNDRLKRKY